MRIATPEEISKHVIKPKFDAIFSVVKSLPSTWHVIDPEDLPDFGHEKLGNIIAALNQVAGLNGIVLETSDSTPLLVRYAGTCPAPKAK